MSRLSPRALRRVLGFAFVILLIEFLDEFVYSAGQAAWPIIRTDLGLNYAQIGVLMGAPGVIGNCIEPALGILGDVWRRRVLVLGGGIAFGAAFVLIALSRNYASLLLAFAMAYPASGAFVSLSQATLMDNEPARHEQNMARWTFAGSVGVVAGPLALGAATLAGLGWRGLYIIFAILTVGLLTLAWRMPYPDGRAAAGAGPTVLPSWSSFTEGFRGALSALRRREVLRWLALLEFSDLMLDVLLGYLALYFVDVAKVPLVQAEMAVAVWTGVGLLGDLLLISLLERVRGLPYLRVSVVIELLLYPAFLLAPWFAVKLVILALLGFFNAGWYSILQAGLYSAMPGQSGTTMSITDVGGIVGSLIPLGLGLAAERFGLSAAMWLLLAGPVVLLVGLPRTSPAYAASVDAGE